MKLLREGAGKGIAIVLISQSPADFKQKFGYHEHIGNVFLFNTNAVDATSVKQLMRCTDDYSHTVVGQVLQLPAGFASSASPVVAVMSSFVPSNFGRQISSALKNKRVHPKGE